MEQTAAFAFGVAIGALLLGTTLIGVGQVVALVVNPLAVAFLAVGLTVSGAALVAEILGVEVPPPTRHWLVPQQWVLLGPTAFALLFGFALGCGFITMAPFIGLHLLSFAGVLWLSPGVVVAAFLGFAVGRMILVVIGSLDRAWRTAIAARTPSGSRPLARRARRLYTRWDIAGARVLALCLLTADVVSRILVR